MVWADNVWRAGSGQTWAAVVVAVTLIYSQKFVTSWLIKHKGLNSVVMEKHIVVFYMLKVLIISLWCHLNLQQELVVDLIY